jgi:hypothetical protein
VAGFGLPMTVGPGLQVRCVQARGFSSVPSSASVEEGLAAVASGVGGASAGLGRRVRRLGRRSTPAPEWRVGRRTGSCVGAWTGDRRPDSWSASALPAGAGEDYLPPEMRVRRERARRGGVWVRRNGWPPLTALVCECAWLGRRFFRARSSALVGGRAVAVAAAVGGADGRRSGSRCVSALREGAGFSSVLSGASVGNGFLAAVGSWVVVSSGTLVPDWWDLGRRPWGLGTC